VTGGISSGRAWLAEQPAGLYPDMAGCSESWALERMFTPEMAE